MGASLRTRRVRAMSSSIASRVQQMQYDDASEGWLHTSSRGCDEAFRAPLAADRRESSAPSAPATGGARSEAATERYRGGRRPSHQPPWLTSRRPPWVTVLVVAGVVGAVYAAARRARKATPATEDDDEDDDDFLFQPF